MKKRFSFLLFALCLTGMVSAQRAALTIGIQHYLAPEAYNRLYLGQNLVTGGNIGLNYWLNRKNAVHIMLGAATNRLLLTGSGESKADLYRSDMVYRRYHRWNDVFSIYGQAGTSLIYAQLEGPSFSDLVICDCLFEFPFPRVSGPTIVTERHLLAGGLAGLGIAIDLSQRISLQTDINAAFYPRKNGYRYFTAVPNLALFYGL